MAMAAGKGSRARAMAGVQAIFDRFHAIAAATSYNGFDRHVMANAKLVDASATPLPSATFELTITENYGNINKVMHGGAAGVIFDMCTTSALGPVARPGYWDFLGGVTRTLSISYLKAIPIDTPVRIHSTVLQVGRTMAMIRGQMTNPDGSIIYCTCEHHKVAVPSKPEHMAAEYDSDWDRIWREDGGEAGGEDGGLRRKGKL